MKKRKIGWMRTVFPQTESVQGEHYMLLFTLLSMLLFIGVYGVGRWV